MKAPLRNGLIALAAVLVFLVFSVSAGLFGAWVLVLTPRPAGGEHTVTVCATTDLHGAYFPENYDGSENAASLANVSTALQSLRAAGKDPILVDVGDNLQGDNAAFYYNYVDTTSEHVFAAMARYLGYDAIVVGNHDIEAGHGVYDRLKRRHAAPLLAANAIHTKGLRIGKPYFKPYHVVLRDRMRIAVIGMTNANIKAWLSEEKWNGMDFIPISEIAQKWVDRVRKRVHPDLVILAVHSGVGTGEGPDTENEALYLASTLEGVDLVLCGHDHCPRVETVSHADGSQTLLIDAGTKARLLGEATFKIEISRRRVSAKSGAAQLLEMRGFAPDTAFTARFAPQFEAVRAYALRPVGELTAPLSFEDALEGPSAYMSLIHRTQLFYSGADVSISAPLARPIAAATQRPAAVVMPRMEFFWKIITPAPMKPMPETTCAATRAASKRPLKANCEIIMKRALPSATMKCVRTPASLALNSRSKPISPPRSPATNILSMKFHSIVIIQRF